MRTVVEVFEPGQLESLSRIEAGELVEKAIAHHAGQLSELGVLLKELFSQREESGRSDQIDGDYFLPTLRGLIKERYDILDRLEDDFYRIQDMDRPPLVAAAKATRTRVPKPAPVRGLPKRGAA